MPRIFQGRVRVRIPPPVHEEVAKEAVEKGISISGIFAQALNVRRALQNTNPWKSIAAVQKANSDLSSNEIEAAVAQAVSDVRRSKHRRHV